MPRFPADTLVARTEDMLTTGHIMAKSASY